MDDVRVWLSRRKLASRGKRERFAYHARWVDPKTGKWVSRKLDETDRDRARVAALKIEDELQEGTFRDLRKMTWAEFTTEHLFNLDVEDSTYADIERTLKAFADACHPSGPRAVTFVMIESYVSHMKEAGNTLATRNKRLRYLRATFNAAVKRDYMAVNPMSRWRWRREEVKRPRVLTDDEKAKLLAACPTEQWRTFVSVALTTGCRLGELLGLEWRVIDFDSATMTVTATKAHRDRVQPLNAEAVTMLRALQASTLADGGPFRSIRNRKWASIGFKDIVKTAGIDRCTIHDLRRTFCTDLARLGVNQLVVQKLAGHASSATTERYYQWIDDGTKRDAVAKLGKTA